MSPSTERGGGREGEIEGRGDRTSSVCIWPSSGPHFTSLRSQPYKQRGWWGDNDRMPYM